MRIEAGKRYVDRAGNVYGPVYPPPPGHWHTRDVWYDKASDTSWRENGEFDPAQPGSSIDLVSEYVEPIAPTYDGPVDADSPAGYVDLYAVAANDALAEVRRAKALWPGNANSAHEQFAVTDEEIDELLDAAGVERLHLLMAARGRLWAHVKVNQKRRDLAAMRKEAIQVAAMALRFAAECCDETTGRK